MKPITSTGIDNRHNGHWCSDENPHRVLHVRQQRFSVWCPLTSHGTLAYGIYVHTIIISVVYSIAKLQTSTKLNSIWTIYSLNDIGYIFCQQNGTPPYNTSTVTELLNENFGNNWIGTNGPLWWYPRSPDLTLLGFFLAGHDKAKLYKITTN